MKVHDAGSALQFRWVVYGDNGRPIAAFTKENEAEAYKMHLRKVMAGIKGKKK